MKYFCLFFVALCSYSIHLIAQRDLSVHDKYRNSNDALIHLNNRHSAFFGIDTLEGYEIDYYYMQKNRKDKCSNLKFFIAERDVRQQAKMSFKKFMKVNGVSLVPYIKFTQLVAVDFSDNDTPYYINDHSQYYTLNFKSIVGAHIFYRISNEEFVTLYKVKVIVDSYYTADPYLYKLFHPLLSTDVTPERVANLVLQYHYRRVLRRVAVDAPFFIDKIARFSIDNCSHTYH